MTDKFELIDPDPIKITIPTLKARQPIGDLFFSTMSHDQIVKITYFDVRRVLQDSRDVERYLGIQRPLNISRVGQLNEYVNFYDATFPTAIILAVDEQYADYNEVTKELTLSNVKRGDVKPTIAISNIARVLDGQHRIAGLREFGGKNFDVPVTIFIGADIADQAHIFATVNLEQQKVNKSLTYDLYSLANSRSPQKTCHSVAVVLDRDPDSPFYERIKRLGLATEGRDFEPISQAAFVESLMKYISRDAKQDRDIILRGGRLEPIVASELWDLPFRNMFILERDVQIVQVMYDYFSAVKERWPHAWEDKSRGNMLNRTNGFRALMRAFKHIHRLHGLPSGKVPRGFFDSFLAAVPLDDHHFNIDRFPPGTSGEAALFRELEAVKI